MGIDLGTSNSCIAIWVPGEGQAKLSHVIAATRYHLSGIFRQGMMVGKSKQRIVSRPTVGKTALDWALKEPHTTIVGAKRLMATVWGQRGS